MLLPSLPLPPAPGTHLVSFGPRGPNISLQGREMVRCCKDVWRGQGRQYCPGDPSPWGCIVHPLALQPPGSLTLSPRSPRFPGKPCGREERGGQGEPQPRVQPGEGGIYRRTAIPFWPRAPIFTL